MTCMTGSSARKNWTGWRKGSRNFSSNIYNKEDSEQYYSALCKAIDWIVDNNIDFSMTINKYYAWTSLNMAKHIYGDDLLQIYDFNKYNLINSKPYRQTLCKYIKNEFMCVRKRFFVSKNDFTTNPRRDSNYLWKCYRLLLICYIINNNSYNLTNEQIKMLNKVHDEKDMSEELWAWCENIIETEAL